MTDADDRSNVRNSRAKHFVSPHFAFPAKTVQAVIGKHTAYTHRATADDRLTRHAAQASMTVYDIDILADENIAQDWHESKELR